jgi:hypothetical protein
VARLISGGPICNLVNPNAKAANHNIDDHVTCNPLVSLTKLFSSIVVCVCGVCGGGVMIEAVSLFQQTSMFWYVFVPYSVRMCFRYYVCIYLFSLAQEM